LVKLGHEVYIITSEHDDAIPRENVVRVPGVRLPMKGLKEYRIGKVTRRRVKEIAKYDFDVIHCHTEFTIGRIGRCIAKKYNIPLVHTYHTMYEEYVHFVSKTFARSLRFLSKKYFKSFANSADVVIFPTKKVKDRFKEYGYQKEGRIVPTGIYLEKFRKINFSTNELNQLKDTLGIEENDFVLMFLGRVSREKSLGDLITNFKTIVQPNIKLLIVGGGPDEDHFKKMVSDLDLKDNVIFTGMVSQVDVPMYYHLGNLFGNFSMTETQGLTYCEALASSLPLLVKYDKNLDGVIENGVNGYTFNTNEEFEMTFNMIYKNPIMYNELKTKASLNIQQFSAQTYGKKVLEIYQDLIGKK
jgi:1,2-diacylglycerol 3-alpha-glucosyltransferase